MAKASPRGASRSQPQTKRQMPSWLILFTGVAVGLFVAFIYHLAQLQADTPDNTLAEPVVQQQEKTVPEKPKADSGPEFDFYAVLPKMESVTEKPKQSDTKESDSDSAETPSNVQLSPIGQGTYMLQAGSFRKKADADKLRADFILMGLDVNVDKAELKNGVIWYRVMVGPFNGRMAMRKARSTLSSHHVNTLVVRIDG